MLKIRDTHVWVERRPVGYAPAEVTHDADDDDARLQARRSSLRTQHGLTLPTGAGPEPSLTPSPLAWPLQCRPFTKTQLHYPVSCKIIL